MKKCLNCGAELSDDAVFCSHCGMACEAGSTASATDTTATDETMLLEDDEATAVLEEDADSFAGSETGETVVAANEIPQSSFVSKPSVNETDNPASAVTAQTVEQPVQHHEIPREQSKGKPGKKVVIILVICILAVVIGGIGIWFALSAKENNATPAQTQNTTISAQQQTEENSAQSQVKIVSISNNGGMTSNDANLSQNGYKFTEKDDEGEYEVRTQGLCIYGNLEYSADMSASVCKGTGGIVLDENGAEIDQDSLTNHAQEVKSSPESAYAFSFYSNSDSKRFLIGLPDDIKPGKYTLQIYQFFNDKDVFMDINIEVYE